MIGTILLFLFEVFTALTVGYCVWWYVIRPPKNIPPGPRGIPLLGYMPFMSTNPGRKFIELGKKYGPIISFERGPHVGIMINDYNLMKKTFQDDNFTGKPEGTGPAFLDSDATFIIQDGQKWHEGRRFALTTLRNFGMGKSSMEPKMLDEISYFLAYLKEQKGRAFEICEVLALSISNIGTLLQFSKRFDYKDPDRLEVRTLISKMFRSPYLFILIPVFPQLAKWGLHKYLPGYSNNQKCNQKMKEILDVILEEHKRNHYPGKMDDYVDAFLSEREERIKKNDHPEYFDDETLHADIKIMSMVANETSALLLNWAFIYLMAHPDIQRKIQAELDNVVGRNRQPSMSDRPNLPYTEAFITELFRRAPLLPIIDAKRAREDTYLEGYFIPKNSHVFGNLWAIHFDEKHFADPESFRPERFIDEEGKVIKADRLVNFGSGKRNCIAENLGRMAIFLYLTSILQSYTLIPPENEFVSMAPDKAFAILAKPYKLRVVEREN